MSSFQGAYLSEAITHAGQWVEERRILLTRYEQLLANSPIEIVLPPEGVSGNGYLAVLRLPKEQVIVVQSRLTEAGIGTGRVYPETIHKQRPAEGAARYSNLTVSTQFTQQVLNLPLFPGLSNLEQDTVVETLLSTASSIANYKDLCE
jgi:UDP-4-amino-4-deoxy-L-arabinose-oxoglutarate aminotransferase